MRDDIDFQGLGMLVMLIGYAHATKRYTGRSMLENLVAALEKFKHQRDNLRKMNEANARRADKAENLTFELETLKLRISGLRRELRDLKAAHAKCSFPTP